MKKLFENWRKYTILNEATFAGAQEMIEQQKIPFFIVSAARSERGTKYSRGNIDAARDLKSFFKQKRLSYTIVDGGYTEKLRDPDTGEETGETLDVQEESYLVFGDVPHYGEEEGRIQDIQALFDIAKEACLVDPENPQESFSFGYPRTVNDPVSGERTEMFIALYLNDAPAPGAENAYTEWGGPWTSFSEFMSDEGAYTKVRGTKGTFAETMLKEARNQKVTSVLSGYKKRAKVEYWTKLRNRWLAENRRKSEASKS